MRVVLFYHSLLSDWNHGNAHFLRGVGSELLARGHDVRVYEPRGGWSLTNLLAEHGEEAVARFEAAYPGLQSRFYSLPTLDLDAVLDGAALVIVHEWNEPELVARIGAHRARARGYRLFFHDTHHRSVTDPEAMARLSLEQYDGVLAYGEAVREQYLRHDWASRVWVWHEAADVRIFRPGPAVEPEADLVWVGNWGDDERSAELVEFLLEPVATLRLHATVYGVRYPNAALAELARAGCTYRGWLANHDVPRAFAAHRATVHVPRRAYARELPGIPTIRPFEALACGIPLVSAWWSDAESLFRVGEDFLMARNGREMKRHLAAVLGDRALAASLASHGHETILARHTCAHRVDELLCHMAEAAGESSPDGCTHAAPDTAAPAGPHRSHVVCS